MNLPHVAHFLRPALGLGVVAMALLIGAPARGEEVVGALSLASGGATRAAPRDNSALDTNAASLAMVPRYLVEVGFQYYGRLKSKRLLVSASDSRTSTFALGVGYVVDWWEPPFDPAIDLAWYDQDASELRDKRRTHLVNIALAQGLLDRRINVGVTGRILNYEQDLRPDVKRFTLDVSGAFRVAQNVALFVVGNNLVPTKLASDPTTITTGVGVQLGPLRTEADVIVDFTSEEDRTHVDLQAGGEVMLFQQVALSGGFQSERTFVDNYVTWGVAWILPSFGVGYAMRVEVGALDERTRPDVEPGWDRIFHAVTVQVSPPRN